MDVAETTSIPWAAIGPIALVLIAFVVYCLIDVSRSEVRGLPKWAWAVICVISIPLGGIVYLIAGRDSGRSS